MHGFHRAFAALLLLAASVTSGGSAEDCVRTVAERPVWSIPMVVGGRARSLEIWESDLKTAPPWDPQDEGEPPVAVGEAIHLATSEIHRFLGDSKEWAFNTVQLQRMGTGQWFYMVSWTPVDRWDTGMISVAVLMSGNVVPLDRQNQNESSGR